RHQLVAIRKIDSIDTRVFVWRTTDPDVDFFGARFFEVVHARLAGGAPDDGIIHDDDPFAANQFGNEVQLYSHVEVTNELGGLEKASAHIVIADECHLIRNVGLQRIAQRGAIAAVGHRHHN